MFSQSDNEYREFARKIAHDIAVPIAGLQVLAGATGLTSEQHHLLRTMISRLNEIAEYAEAVAPNE